MLFGEFAHGLQIFIHRLLAVQIDRMNLLDRFAGVGVTVEEAGQHHFAFQIDDFGLGACDIFSHRHRFRQKDAPVFDRDGFRPVAVFVHRVNGSILQNQIGLLVRRQRCSICAIAAQGTEQQQACQKTGCPFHASSTFLLKFNFRPNPVILLGGIPDVHHVFPFCQVLLRRIDGGVFQNGLVDQLVGGQVRIRIRVMFGDFGADVRAKNEVDECLCRFLFGLPLGMTKLSCQSSMPSWGSIVLIAGFS